MNGADDDGADAGTQSNRDMGIAPGNVGRNLMRSGNVSEAARFGGLAISERPMALRPDLAAGLPLSTRRRGTDNNEKDNRKESERKLREQVRTKLLAASSDLPSPVLQETYVRFR